MEVPCGLACGKLVRDWVLVTVRGAGIVAVDESRAGDDTAADVSRIPYALEVRACSPCFQLFMHAMSATAKDVEMAHRKRTT